MSAAFTPLELLAVLLAPAAMGLAVVFVAPETFHLRSSGSRVAGLRIFVGVIWAGDAVLKFLPGATPLTAYYLLVSQAGLQPSVSGWFSFWASLVASNPGLWWYGAGIIEFLLAASLIFGLARRLAYAGGSVFSLALWLTAEGFGGPYEVGTIDLGVGLASALLLLALWQVESVSGPAVWAADVGVERRWGRWRILGGPSHVEPTGVRAEADRSISGRRPTDAGPATVGHRIDTPKPSIGVPSARGDIAVRSRRRLLRERNLRRGERAILSLEVAFEALVLLFTSVLFGLAMIAAIGPRWKAFFACAAARTAALRIFFGGMWLALAALILTVTGLPPGAGLSYWLVVMASDSQPAWLQGWFSFWESTIALDPWFWWYGLGLLELFLAVCLIAGLLRRPIYLVGVAVSLFLWTVPGGFGGPYLPGFTDMGAGILNAAIFLALLYLDSMPVPPRFAVDAALARRSSTWRRLTATPYSLSTRPGAGSVWPRTRLLRPGSGLGAERREVPAPGSPQTTPRAP